MREQLHFMLNLLTAPLFSPKVEDKNWEQESSQRKWPPTYEIRLSHRAKKINLQVTRQRGLEIIVPFRKRNVSNSYLNLILNDHKAWIEKQLYKLTIETESRKVEPILPTSLCFPAFQKQIMIEYYHVTDQKIKTKLFNLKDSPTYLEHSSSENVTYHLKVTGDINNHAKILLALKKILYKEAKLFLIPWLQTLSSQTGLNYNHASIRSQSTLWGSCTVSKKISLNAKLLFLPKELIQYVLLHELCHLKYLDHSSNFWDLLKIYDPNCLEHRKKLRHISKTLPVWIEAK